MSFEEWKTHVWHAQYTCTALYNRRLRQSITDILTSRASQQNTFLNRWSEFHSQARCARSRERGRVETICRPFRKGGGKEKKEEKNHDATPVFQLSVSTCSPFRKVIAPSDSANSSSERRRRPPSQNIRRATNSRDMPDPNIDTAFMNGKMHANSLARFQEASLADVHEVSGAGTSKFG